LKRPTGNIKCSAASWQGTCVNIYKEAGGIADHGEYACSIEESCMTGAHKHSST